MYVRTLTTVMVGNKVVNKGGTARVNATEAHDLITRGYAEKAEAGDEATTEDKPKPTSTKQTTRKATAKA